MGEVAAAGTGPRPELENHAADRVAVGEGRARARRPAVPVGAQEYVSGNANIDETSRDHAGSHYLQKTSAVGMYPQGASPYGVHGPERQCLGVVPERVREAGARPGGGQPPIACCGAARGTPMWTAPRRSPASTLEHTTVASTSGFGWWGGGRPLFVALTSGALASEL